MLKSIDGQYSFPISKMELVNSGGAVFLTVICENVQIHRHDVAQMVYQRWEISGMGNQFRTRRLPVLDSKLHAPAVGESSGTIGYELNVELFFPPGTIEINFGPIPPTPLPMPSSSSSSSEVVEIPVVTIDDRRDFDNLDLE